MMAIRWNEIAGNSEVQPGEQVRIYLGFSCLPFTCPSESDLKNLQIAGIGVESADFPLVGLGYDAVIQGRVGVGMTAGEVTGNTLAALNVLAGDRITPLTNLRVLSVEKATQRSEDETTVPEAIKFASFALLAIVAAYLIWKVT